MGRKKKDLGGIMFQFSKGDNVLCYYKQMLYKATCLELKLTKDGQPLYKVHYTGWKNHWNEWVNEEKLLTANETNIALMEKIKNEQLNKIKEERLNKAMKKKSNLTPKKKVGRIASASSSKTSKTMNDKASTSATSTKQNKKYQTRNEPNSSLPSSPLSTEQLNAILDKQRVEIRLDIKLRKECKIVLKRLPNDLTGIYGLGQLKKREITNPERDSQPNKKIKISDGVTENVDTVKTVSASNFSSGTICSSIAGTSNDAKIDNEVGKILNIFDNEDNKKFVEEWKQKMGNSFENDQKQLLEVSATNCKSCGSCEVNKVKVIGYIEKNTFKSVTALITDTSDGSSQTLNSVDSVNNKDNSTVNVIEQYESSERVTSSTESILFQNFCEVLNNNNASNTSNSKISNSNELSNVFSMNNTNVSDQIKDMTSKVELTKNRHASEAYTNKKLETVTINELSDDTSKVISTFTAEKANVPDSNSSFNTDLNTHITGEYKDIELIEKIPISNVVLSENLNSIEGNAGFLNDPFMDELPESNVDVISASNTENVDETSNDFFEGLNTSKTGNIEKCGVQEFNNQSDLNEKFKTIEENNPFFKGLFINESPESDDEITNVFNSVNADVVTDNTDFTNAFNLSETGKNESCGVQEFNNQSDLNEKFKTVEESPLFLKDLFMNELPESHVDNISITDTENVDKTGNDFFEDLNTSKTGKVEKCGAQEFNNQFDLNEKLKTIEENSPFLKGLFMNELPESDVEMTSVFNSINADETSNIDFTKVFTSETERNESLGSTKTKSFPDFDFEDKSETDETNMSIISSDVNDLPEGASEIVNTSYINNTNVMDNIVNNDLDTSGIKPNEDVEAKTGNKMFLVDDKGCEIDRNIGVLPPIVVPILLKNELAFDWFVNNNYIRSLQGVPNYSVANVLHDFVESQKNLAYRKRAYDFSLCLIHYFNSQVNNIFLYENEVEGKLKFKLKNEFRSSKLVMVNTEFPFIDSIYPRQIWCYTYGPIYLLRVLIGSTKMYFSMNAEKISYFAYFIEKLLNYMVLNYHTIFKREHYYVEEQSTVLPLLPQQN